MREVSPSRHHTNCVGGGNGIRIVAPQYNHMTLTLSINFFAKISVRKGRRKGNRFKLCVCFCVCVLAFLAKTAFIPNGATASNSIATVIGTLANIL